MKMLFAIAMGGALGALARFYLSSQITRLAGHDWPWGIFVVNIAGSFAMGVLIHAMTMLAEPMPTLRAFLAVGVLGAFTTFSTFSLDTVVLLERGQLGPATLYVGGSVILSVAGLFAGLTIARVATG